MIDQNFVPDFDTVTPAELLEINSKLVRSWPGETLQGISYARSVNSAGAKVPLIWIFQSQSEFSSLVSVLPAEQPVHALRSMVFHRSEEELKRNIVFMKDEFQDPICEAYANDIGNITQGGPYLLGGNCGAATIAVNIALRAIRKPDRLFIMNLLQDASRPYTGDTELLFGSEERASFEVFPVGPAAFPNSRMTELAGPHGSYFGSSEVERIASVICSHSPVLL